MHPKSKISVIIPTLNEELLLERAIQSASDADEIIVVDGGSQDRSVALARRTEAIVVHAAKGRGVQLRAGVKNSTGNVLLLLHADSWLGAGAIQEIRQLAVDSANPVYGCFRQRIEDPRYRYRILEAGNAFRAKWFCMPYGDQAVFIDRESYEAVEGFDDVPIMEDVLFSRRLKAVGRPTLLSGRVHLSARRWNRRGVILQTMKNWIILGAFYLGVSPTRLARWYR